MKNVTNKIRILVDGLNKFDTFEELGNGTEEYTQTIAQRDK